MKRTTILFAALILAVAPAYAQTAGDLFGGDVGPGYARNIDSQFQRLTVDAIASDPAYLQKMFPASMLDPFFKGTFVKVTLYPDGSYAVLSQPGGEVTGFKVGKSKVTTGGDTWESDGWNLKAGEYAAPKRRSEVTIGISAGGQQMEVECLTRFERSEHAITYFIGPMNGMQCLGLADDSILSAYDMVRIAESEIEAPAPASGM